MCNRPCQRKGARKLGKFYNATSWSVGSTKTSVHGSIGAGVSSQSPWRKALPLCKVSLREIRRHMWEVSQDRGKKRQRREWRGVEHGVNYACARRPCRGAIAARTRHYIGVIDGALIALLITCFRAPGVAERWKAWADLLRRYNFACFFFQRKGSEKWSH